MESVKCAICSSDKSVLFHNKDSFNIVKCVNCELVYVSPRLTFEELEEFYATSYYEYVDSYDHDLRRRKGAIKWIRKYKSSGKLLDIGCSVGSMLEAAKKYFDPLGIDVAEWSLEEARKRNLNVLNGTLDDLKFEKETFDVITFTEVIEHIHDPVSFLKEVNRVLKPEGVIYITTGNIDGFRARRDGNKWYYLTPQYHIYFFSPKTIRKILKQSGFEVLEIGGLFPLQEMFPLWKHYSNKWDFVKACIGKISFSDFTFGDMGIIARKVRSVENT